jgi:hypothetical protein
MGCSYSPETIEKEIRSPSFPEVNSISGSEAKLILSAKDISLFIYQKLEKFIGQNPLYNIEISKFEDFLNSIETKKTEEKNNNKEIIDKFISLFFNNVKNYVKILFNKVIEYSFEKYSFGINNKNKNILIKVILIFIYIFFTENKAGKKSLFKKNILELLKYNIENNDEKNNKYKRENVFDLFINMVQIHTIFFENFLLYFALSETIKNEYDNYEKIINEDSAINKINSFVESNLKIINDNISSDYLNLLFISEINNKIQSCLQWKNEEDSFILDENEINIISDSIYEIIDINNYMKFIFFGENHNY